MTRLTALLIRENDTVKGTSFGPVAGKFGFTIYMMDHAPSGAERPRTLVISEPSYESRETAQVAADAVIAEVRK